MLFTCGDLTWDVKMANDDTPDPTIFTIEMASAEKSIAISSNDLSQAGTYDLYVEVYYDLYPDNKHSKFFKIILEDPCLSAILTIDPAAY